MERNSSHQNGGEVSKDRLRLWLSLLRTVRLTESELRENLRTQHNTTLPRFDVLATLDRFPKGLKMNELSEQLLVSNGSATVVVDRLVSEGLVSRTQVPGDRRALKVMLTTKGRKRFKRLAQEHETWINSQLSNITSKDAQRVTKILDGNRKKLGEQSVLSKAH